LNGAQYAYVQSRRGSYNIRCSAKYRIVDDKVEEKATCDDGDRVSEASFTYPIQGQTFYVDMNSFSSTGDFCQSSRINAKECGYVGTITEKGISFEFIADGRKRKRVVAGPIGDYIPRL
jgi:hypothetical protein